MVNVIDGDIPSFHPSRTQRMLHWTRWVCLWCTAMLFSRVASLFLLNTFLSIWASKICHCLQQTHSLQPRLAPTPYSPIMLVVSCESFVWCGALCCYAIQYGERYVVCVYTTRIYLGCKVCGNIKSWLSLVAIHIWNQQYGFLWWRAKKHCVHVATNRYFFHCSSHTSVWWKCGFARQIATCRSNAVCPSNLSTPSSDMHMAMPYLFPMPAWLTDLLPIYTCIMCITTISSTKEKVHWSDLARLCDYKVESECTIACWWTLMWGLSWCVMVLGMPQFPHLEQCPHKSNKQPLLFHSISRCQSPSLLISQCWSSLSSSLLVLWTLQFLHLQHRPHKSNK